MRSESSMTTSGIGIGRENANGGWISTDSPSRRRYEYLCDMWTGLWTPGTIGVSLPGLQPLEPYHRPFDE